MPTGRRPGGWEMIWLHIKHGGASDTGRQLRPLGQILPSQDRSRQGPYACPDLGTSCAAAPASRSQQATTAYREKLIAITVCQGSPRLRLQTEEIIHFASTRIAAFILDSRSVFTRAMVVAFAAMAFSW